MPSLSPIWLIIGVLLGWLVVPKVLAKLGK